MNLVFASDYILLIVFSDPFNVGKRTVQFSDHWIFDFNSQIINYLHML